MGHDWIGAIVAVLAALAIMGVALFLFLMGFIVVIHGMLWGWLVLLMACGCSICAMWTATSLLPPREK